MGTKRLTRRDFLKATGTATAMAAVGTLPLDLFAFDRKLVRYPEKTDLLLLTSRPPQLEMPKQLFRELVTPNDALFVRWHLANIPTEVDLGTWRLTVGGNTERELVLSMAELLSSFEPVTYTAVIQCAGNGRSLFEPRVPGGQWENGAIGNVTWTGARLKDILARAGLKKGSVEVAFNGLDAPPLPTVPDFVKSLPVDLARGEDIIVAYAMNGAPLPMLNGFPARLIVPGWYATYWVKALSEITILTKPSDNFWMTTAYRIPDTSCACVPPGEKPERTIPINRMSTRSLIVEPQTGARLAAGRETEITGVAFSGGYGIRDVIVSVDGGVSWREARLGKDLGKHSWIQWRYPWRPEKTGGYRIMARATNSIGESQPFESLWNPAGYRWNRIETVDVTVG
jgi:DMSO/TMAO reductase YedYZ molybdopterin-dependent catalytic subunit